MSHSVFVSVLVLIGSVSFSAKTKWCRLLFVVPFLMKSIMPTLNFQGCVSLLLTIFFWFKTSYNICFILLGLFSPVVCFTYVLECYLICFMVMMDCLLRTCQRKRLKGIISILKPSVFSCFSNNNNVFLLLIMYLSISWLKDMCQTHFEHLIEVVSRCWKL